MRRAKTDFWSKIDRRGFDACWEWKYAKTKGGYGKVRIKNKDLIAHRVAYEMFFGEIPKGMLVCHKCDNRGCCNPKHLFLGTYQDNMSDMVSKKRQGNRGKHKNHAKREKHGRAILKQVDVDNLRKIFSTGKFTFARIARAWGKPYSTIEQAIKGYTWA